MDLILSRNKNQRRELQIVGPINSKPTAVGSSSSSPPFKLPRDWVVELRPRRSSHRSDKYYREPGTGRQFRSLLSVQRYLCGEITSDRMRLGNEKNMPIVPYIFNRCSSFGLPDGWIVEEMPRSNINYQGVVDRTYIEPGTGKRFRSLLSVERYIAEGKGYAATSKPDHLCLTDWKEHTRSNASGSQKKHGPGNDAETSSLDLHRPPANIKWVLSPVGYKWSPFIDDKPVPESLKRKWSRTLYWTLNNGQ